MTSIILVEDDPDDIYFFKSACSSAIPSATVVILNDGLQLLGYLENNICSNSIIMLDLNMPKLNGMDVLRELHNNNKINELFIITYTTSANECDIKEAYQLGVKSYLTKPDNSKDLRALLLSLQDYWFRHNCFPD